MSGQSLPFRRKYTLNCRGKLVNLDEPVVMGILNCTPDSFFKGSRVQLNEVVTRAKEMLEAGAGIIDIGGWSSRAGSVPVTEAEERSRVIPALVEIRKHLPEAIVSVDTYRAGIAAEAIAQGADLINDISAGSMDDQMHATIARIGCPYLIMHMRGTPENMQDHIDYGDITTEVIKYFSQLVFDLRRMGIADLLIDPGFGFGKTVAHNYQILSRMNDFQILGCPVVAGLSRKSMLWKPLNIDSGQALNATTVANTVALMNGAQILRVHDVREAMECVAVLRQLNG